MSNRILIKKEQVWPDFLVHYNESILEMMTEKYGLDELTSLRNLVYSDTYSMLSDPELNMWDFGEGAIFDMWETERITGNPRNSAYLRME